MTDNRLDADRIICGDCLEILPTFPDGSIDLVLTDPPYGYSFMGKDWDKVVPPVAVWEECLRVLKPGAFAFVMSAPRQDVLSRMIVNLSDAGFETGFTSIYWTYASGFPKASDVSKAIDRKFGAEREVVGIKPGHESFADRGMSSVQSFKGVLGGVGGFARPWMNDPDKVNRYHQLTKAETPQAKRFAGAYAGFQPKPALECIITCQKNLTLTGELITLLIEAITVIKETEKWSNVNTVEKSSFLQAIQKEFIAQENVVEKTAEEAMRRAGEVASHYGLMGMLKYTLDELAIKQDMKWNTGLLWRCILVEGLSMVNKFTTKTTTELIIELKILNSLLLQTMQASTIKEKTQQSGVELNVEAVESIIKSVRTKSQLQKQTIAVGNVSSNTCEENQSINVKDVEKNLEVQIPKESIARKDATIETKVIIVCMKPLSEKTYVEQALANGKGVTWLGDCKIPYIDETPDMGGRKHAKMGGKDYGYKIEGRPDVPDTSGRFPANLLVSDDVLNDGVVSKSIQGKKRTASIHNITKLNNSKNTQVNCEYSDSGSYSRYFDLDAFDKKTFPFAIVPKPSKAEKNAGLEGVEKKFSPTMGDGVGGKPHNPETATKKTNSHPTVKPLKLMRYLITLASRPGDIILDPYVGSGSTAVACKELNRKYIGIELDEAYCAIARKRIEAVQPRLKL